MKGQDILAVTIHIVDTIPKNYQLGLSSFLTRNYMDLHIDVISFRLKSI